jgi:MYXO-CTERM domain-containing protein
MLSRVFPRFSPLRSVIAAAASVAMLATATTAHAEVAWVGGFETGDLSQWTFIAHGEYIDVQTDLVGEGEYAARVELHNDAVWPNGLQRVELQHLPDAARTSDGETTWFAWSFYLPEALPEEPYHAIGYWESNNTWMQSMAFIVRGDDIEFVTRHPSHVSQWQADDVVTPGVWHRIAMRITWSLGTGSVDVWYDGNQVVDGAEARTLSDGNPHFVQIGLFREPAELDEVPVIILDDAVEGDSFEDVRPADVPGVGGEDGGSSDDGGESTAGPADDTGGSGGEVGGLDTSGGGVGDGATTGATGDDAADPPAGSSTGDGALPPGFGSVEGDAGASDDDGAGCQCRSSGSGRSGAAWGLVALLLLGVRRRLVRRR